MSKELPAAPKNPEGAFFRTFTVTQAQPGSIRSGSAPGMPRRAVLSVSRSASSPSRTAVVPGVRGDLETDRPVAGARAALYYRSNVVSRGHGPGWTVPYSTTARPGDEPRLIGRGRLGAFTRLDSVYGVRSKA